MGDTFVNISGEQWAVLSSEERHAHLHRVTAEIRRVQALFEERTKAALAKPKGLRDYLKGLDPEAYAGVPGGTTSCPIALYLYRAVVGPLIAETNSVWPTRVRVTPLSVKGIHDARVRMPAWANRFVNRVDALPNGEVSASTALKMLRAATARAEKERGG
jgi:hypothetical protein